MLCVFIEPFGLRAESTRPPRQYGDGLSLGVPPGLKGAFNESLMSLKVFSPVYRGCLSLGSVGCAWDFAPAVNYA